MRKLYLENREWADKALFVLGFFVFAYVFLAHILRFVSPFVAGFFLSVVISPLVGFVQRRLKIARGISTIFLIIGVILLVAVIAVSVFNQILIEAQQLSLTLPQTLENLRNMLFEVEDLFDRYIYALPVEFVPDFNGMINGLIAFLAAAVGDFAASASVNVIMSLPVIVMNVLLCFISAFFFAKDKKIIAGAVMSNLPEGIKPWLGNMRKGLFSSVWGYVRAQLIIMVVVGTIGVLGLAMLRYPYAVLMGLLLALFDILPVVGRSVIFWPWAIVNFVAGNHFFAVGIIVVNIVCFIARQIIEPKVLGKSIGLHPLLVLIGIYLGFRVFGLIGLFIGPFLFVIAKLCIESSKD